jgi:hypothetical protein
MAYGVLDWLGAGLDWARLGRPRCLREVRALRNGCTLLHKRAGGWRECTLAIKRFVFRPSWILYRLFVFVPIL